MKPTIYILISLFCITICPILHTQNRVSYLYDAAGNRISRTIVLSPRSAPTGEEKPAVYTETLADIKVKIYPNPTTGLVTVEIANLPEDQTSEIRLYNMYGQLINTYREANNIIRINLTNQPAAIYVMKIMAGEHQTEWKIIKK